jgi:branched-chain amino acid transport system ATP-binding protein
MILIGGPASIWGSLIGAFIGQPSELVELYLGRETPVSRNRVPALAVRDVSLRFGGVAALSDLSLALDQQSVLGIIRPNGFGKTSLLNCISGAYKPQMGVIEVAGRQMPGLAPHRIAAGVARTFRHIEVLRELTVLELAMLGRHRLMGRFGLLAYGLWIPSLKGSELGNEPAGRGALDRVGIGEPANDRTGDLSYGFAKRGRHSARTRGRPNLLLLDEPAAGLREAERRTGRTRREPLGQRHDGPGRARHAVRVSRVPRLGGHGRGTSRIRGHGAKGAV